MIKRLSALLFKGSLLFWSSISIGVIAAPLTDFYMFSNFESENFVTRPSKPVDDYARYEWSFIPGEAGVPRLGYSEFSNAQPYKGLFSLSATIEGIPDPSLYPSIAKVTNIYVQYYPYDDSSFQWRYIREQEAFKGKVGYKLNTYNRMRMRVLVPPENVSPNPEYANFHVGTYFRATGGARNSAESGGNHFYHHFNLPYMGGVWHQVIVDTHPNHIRGKSGNLEHGNQEYPTNESGYNYFDLMTRFYFKVLTQPTGFPATYLFDDVEFYNDPNPGNIDQIYSLHGAYNYKGGSNYLYVGWMRHKDEKAIAHEVRYSFSDIHDSGWDSASPAPNGIVYATNSGGYNGMRYETSGIDMQSNQSIFIAIKPANSDVFRQIELPLTSASDVPGVSLPNAPTGVTLEAQ